MSKIWQELLYRLGFKHRTRCYFNLDEELVEALRAAAQEEQRSEDEVVARLLSASLTLRQQAAINVRNWESLSDREKQVAALACLRYTYRQTAGLLHLSPQTIKSHMQSVLRKFGLRRKEELRLQLSQWDFRDWDIGRLEGEGDGKD
jgi:DNA-binding CsgD family transcriptional regulator